MIWKPDLWPVDNYYFNISLDDISEWNLMTAVHPVRMRMKLVVDNIVGLSAMMRRLTCHKTPFNPGNPAVLSVKMGKVANLNIGPSYQINEKVVNTGLVVNQRVKLATNLQTREKTVVFNRVAEL